MVRLVADPGRRTRRRSARSTPSCARTAEWRTCRSPCAPRRPPRTPPTRPSPVSTTPTCGCAGADEVLEKVRACWASLFTDRAIAYREEMGYDHTEVDMGVAVQKMVRPRAAGVAFTLDPTNGDRSGICIDSAWGFGEGVVSGDVTPDNFLVDKVMWSINRRIISPKTHAYLLERRARIEPRSSSTRTMANAALAHRRGDPGDRPAGPDRREALRLPAGHRVGRRRRPAGRRRTSSCCRRGRRRSGASKSPPRRRRRPDLMTSIVDTLVNPLYSRKGGTASTDRP